VTFILATLATGLHEMSKYWEAHEPFKIDTSENE